jgi:beta-lactamase regulating signal transducer with metallopeptidase domain
METNFYAGSLLQASSILSSAAVSALISAVWEGLVVTVCAAVCLRLLPRLSAAARSLVWMNVFLLLVLLHVVPAIREDLVREGLVSGGSAHTASIYLQPGWSLAIAALWAALSLWRGVELILSAARLHRLAVRATPVVVGDSVRSLLNGEVEGERGWRAAELCVSSEVERPSVFGFVRPRILLPEGLIEKLSSAELQQVVLHEMEHLRRGDDWTNLLQKIGLMLFPLNPALLWAERRLCAERELACDDRVLESNGARKAYAICLTRLAENSMIRRSVSLALGAWERRPELVNRVHRLLRQPAETMGRRQAKLVTAGLIVGVVGGGMALARSPQLVSFAPLPQVAMQERTAFPESLNETSLRESRVQALGGSVQLVKAVMPQPSIQPAVKTKTQRSKAAGQRVRPRYAEHSTEKNRQAWVVLTEWNDMAPPPRIVFAVDPVNRNSYAAVPIGDGWLILRI